MAEFSRHATVDWKGTLLEGAGDIKAGTGAFALSTTFPKRIGAPEGATSPEELLAAAHALCYAMVVAATMGRKGVTMKSHHVTCTVTSEKTDAGISVLKSELNLVAEGVTGMDAATFAATAKDAEKGCPLSKALRNPLNVEVNVSVK